MRNENKIRRLNGDYVRANGYITIQTSQIFTAGTLGPMLSSIPSGGSRRPYEDIASNRNIACRWHTAVYFVGVRFSCGGDASIFISGPVEAEERHSFAASTGWLFWNIMAHPLIGKEDSALPPRWL